MILRGLVGELVGKEVGALVGASVGAIVTGGRVKGLVGASVILRGLVGELVGKGVGASVGVSVGAVVGLSDGLPLGSRLLDGDSVGSRDGK